MGRGPMEEISSEVKMENWTEKFAQDLDREAEGLRWLGKETPARALMLLARVIRVRKMDSMSDLDLWVRTIEGDSQIP